MTNREAVEWLESQDLSAMERRFWANSMANRSQSELPEGEDDCTVLHTQLFTFKYDHESEGSFNPCYICNKAEVAGGLIVVGE